MVGDWVRDTMVGIVSGRAFVSIRFGLDLEEYKGLMDYTDRVTAMKRGTAYFPPYHYPNGDEC